MADRGRETKNYIYVYKMSLNNVNEIFIFVVVICVYVCVVSVVCTIRRDASALYHTLFLWNKKVLNITNSPE